MRLSYQIEGIIYSNFSIKFGSSVPLHEPGDQTFSGILDGLEVRLDHDTKKGSLLIELYNPQRLILYRARFSHPDEIRNLTDTQLDTSTDLYQLLRRALQTNPPLPIKFDKDEKALIYTWKPFFKMMTWKIPLQNMSQSMEDKVDFLLRKVEQFSAITMHPVFLSNYKRNFEFSADNKQCTKLHNQSVWEGVMGDPKFFHRGKQQFSIKVLSTSSKYIMVGVALSSTDPTSGFYTKSTAWMFSMYHGYIYTSNSAKSYFDTNRVPIMIDDVVTVRVDMETGYMFVDLNGVPLGVAYRLQLTAAQRTELAPAVDFYNVGDSVMFI